MNIGNTEVELGMTVYNGSTPYTIVKIHEGEGMVDVDYFSKDSDKKRMKAKTMTNLGIDNFRLTKGR